MTRRRSTVGAVVALLLGVLALGASPATYGALVGRVTSTTNTTTSQVFASTLTCQTTVRDLGAYAAYPLAEASGLGGATDATGNGRTGSYSLTGVSYAQSGPCPRDAARSVALDGTTGLVRGPAMSNPQTFSVAVWFRTTTTRGGKLAGFGSSLVLTDLSLLYDRHVYLRDDGRLTFGVKSGGLSTVTSSAAYNDGSWHHAVGTLSASGTTKGLRLYVDGALVASDPAVTSAEVYDGAWRFGFDNLDGWPGRPTSSYFAGRIALAAVWTSALAPDQVRWLWLGGR